MIAEVDQVFVAAETAGEIEQGIDGKCPDAGGVDEAVGTEEKPVLLGNHSADVLQLQRVADDDGAAGTKEQRQGGCDVALAGFVDDHQIEECRRERADVAACGECGYSPAGEDFRNVAEERVVAPEDTTAGAFVKAISAGDHLEE